MPTVAIVDGVKIQFFFGDHPPPHFHVDFGDHKAQIRIDDLAVLAGSLPPAKLRSVREWAITRDQLLTAAWDRASARDSPGTIP